MSVKHVKIYYGPCDSFDTIAHKPLKLRGLRDQLRKLGYRVDLAPVDFVNYCVIEMCGHEVFRCNIQNLKFSTPCRLDPVCQRAVNAVLDATTKCMRARNYLWFFTLIEQQILLRNTYGPKDNWSKDIQIAKFAHCLDCFKCCGILAVPKGSNK